MNGSPYIIENGALPLGGWKVRHDGMATWFYNYAEAVAAQRKAIIRDESAHDLAYDNREDSNFGWKEVG